MRKVIGKKSINNIEVGDVVGVTEDDLYFLYTTNSADYFVTVVSVCKVNTTNRNGERVKGFTYKMFCSDGITHNIRSGSTKFFIFDGADAQ